MTHVLKVYRAERFSPNSVSRDRAILDAAGSRFASQGCTVEGVSEDRLDASHAADIYLSMARTPRALDILRQREAEGCTVVNRPDGVTACRRSNVDRLMRSHGLPAAPLSGTSVDRLMRSHGLPAAPLSGTSGYWLKRGDEAAQGRDDVVFARNEAEKDEALRRFKARGVTDVVVTAHVKGDVVKFYGVQGTAFFKTFHADGGYSKFGDEALNGTAMHYAFNARRLQNDAGRLAELTGTDVYGGDCIVREDGTYAIIDFNDWPSFARCRNEAAVAIATRVEEIFSGKKVKKLKGKKN